MKVPDLPHGFVIIKRLKPYKGWIRILAGNGKNEYVFYWDGESSNYTYAIQEK